MRMTRAVRKQPTNLTLRADLVRRAKELGLNLSGLLEDAVERAIREAERKAWLDENEAAFQSANQHMAKHGLFSDDWREF
jgi:antitoxin CcdA